ncbi:hypothetical protein V490_08860 [Pseudogymnoascus sp. VKM F-3557]|nr:hypothetical protein V490_08860 [Pseudogymnoascus sp. VKM F-3557]
MDLMMLHPFPHHANHLSYAATTSAASHDIHTNKRLSSLLPGVDNLLHGDRSGFLGGGKPSHETRSQPEQESELQYLPVEIVQLIFGFLPDIESACALSATCHFFHRAYASSRKLIIVQKVLETQFGPLHDVTQLVTLNSSVLPHQTRDPSFSLALARQIAKCGRTANRWVELYPMLRWRVKPEDRRFLHQEERHRLRRAIYRLWTYNSAYTMDFEASVGPSILRQYPTRELREIDELRAVFRDTLTHDCCLSNSAVQLHYNQGHPTRDLLYFGTYSSYDNDAMLAPDKLKGKSVRDAMAAESWGDDMSVGRKIMRLLYMTPDALLDFHDGCTCKTEREQFLERIGYDISYGWYAGLYSDSYPSDSFQVVEEERNEEPLSGIEQEWITGDGGVAEEGRF